LVTTVKCVRCGSKKNLQEDHIIPKSRGGTDDPSNKRWLCEACHDFRHARDNIIDEINKWIRLFDDECFNSAKFSMYIMRLGVLEAFNTPEKIRERGTYMTYWKIPATRYIRWYPKIKLNRMERCVICGQFCKHSPCSAKCYKEFKRREKEFFK